MICQKIKWKKIPTDLESLLGSHIILVVIVHNASKGYIFFISRSISLQMTFCFMFNAHVSSFTESREFFGLSLMHLFFDSVGFIRFYAKPFLSLLRNLAVYVSHSFERFYGFSNKSNNLWKFLIPRARRRSREWEELTDESSTKMMMTRFLVMAVA